jgi:hypothetical protein
VEVVGGAEQVLAALQRAAALHDAIELFQLIRRDGQRQADRAQAALVAGYTACHDPPFGRAT